MRIGITDWHQATDEERIAVLERPAQRDRGHVAARVRDIIADVRARGDEAVRELTERLDGVRLEDFAVPAREFDTAPELLTAAPAVNCPTLVRSSRAPGTARSTVRSIPFDP